MASARSLFPASMEGLTPAFFRDFIYNAAQEKGVKLPWDIGAPQPSLAAAAHLFHGRVLDVGCGLGQNSLWLASLPTVTAVTALDFAELAITRARALQANAGGTAAKVAFIQADVLDLAFCDPDPHDTLLDSAVFHCIGDDAAQQRYLATVTQHVKLGGTAVMLAYSDANPAPEPSAPAPGPRRISRSHAARLWRGAGWRVDGFIDVRFQSTMHTDHNNHAILMQATRVI